MNQMQAQAMERVGETGEPIVRTPCSVGSGEVAIDEYDRLKQQKDEILRRQTDAQFDAVLSLAQRYSMQASNIWRTFVPHSQGEFIELREFRAALQKAVLDQAKRGDTLDVCTDSDNCNRCKTEKHFRGTLDHAGIPVGNSYGAAIAAATEGAV